MLIIVYIIIYIIFIIIYFELLEYVFHLPYIYSFLRTILPALLMRSFWVV